MSDRPLRVLFLDHTAKLAGGEIALANLLAALDRRRVERAVLLFEDGPLVGRLRGIDVGVDVLPLPASIGSTRKDALGPAALLRAGGVVGFLRRLRRRVRGFDFVYCNSLKSDLLGGLAARAAGVPCVWHVHDRIERDYLPAKVAAAFRLAARTLPRGVVANSRCTLATLRLAKRSRATVAYPGVALPPQPPARPDGPPTVTILGRLAPWKGQHVFFDAAAIVRRRLPTTRFRVVGSAMFGEGEYERDLREQAARLGLSGAVEFRGFRPDVWRELAESTVVVHASTVPEPFGQVVVEAMAAGRPVVATDAGGVRETVVHGESGLLVPPGDAAATAAAVVALLSDPAEWARLSAAGRRRVAEHFTIDRTADAVAGFLQNL